VGLKDYLLIPLPSFAASLVPAKSSYDLVGGVHLVRKGPVHW